MVCIGFSSTCMSLVVHGDNRLLDTTTPTSACLWVLLPWSIDSSIACSSSWSCAARVNVPIVNKEIDSSGTIMVPIDLTTLVPLWTWHPYPQPWLTYQRLWSFVSLSSCFIIAIAMTLPFPWIITKIFSPIMRNPGNLVTKDTTNSME